jgi:serine/threonine-protein kinase
MAGDVGLRAIEVLELSFDQPDETRLDWLRATYGGDPELVSEVEKLLRADSFATNAFPTSGAVISGLHRAAPERIGHYKLAGRLGEGGMGEVYVGERDDGLFDHQVAIKLVRPSLLPETAHALFQKERRALAKLSHRNIAQLFDGGVENGVPFLIMEFVRGKTIDAHAAAGALGPREIAQLMAAVCDAVQFAHQNLIVHADLKPSNILISEAGDPKIVDFGVARILGGAEDGDGALYPRTPGYSSPQRATGAPPTPADDVYALGAILRTLLVGRHVVTNDSKSLTQSIRASFPDKPESWREARASLVRGDLSVIVARGLASEVADRYPSAAEMRDDLKAWLDYRPLATRRGDKVYVFQKFLRRRRLRVIVGVGAVAGLLAALAVSTALYLRADHERELAQNRFDDARALARYLLFDAYDRLERTPRSLAARRDMAATGQSYLDRLAADAEAPTAVRIEVVEGLLRVAELQAGIGRMGLGEFAQAKQSLAQAEALALSVQQRGADLSILRARIALTRGAIAMDTDQDLAEAGRQLALAESLIPASQADLARELQIQKAILANWDGRYADAVPIAQALLADLQRQPAPLSRQLQLMKARAIDALAEALYYKPDIPASEREYRRLVEHTSAFMNANPDDMEARRHAVRARWALGTALLEEGKNEESLGELERAAAGIEPLIVFEPDDDQSQRLQRTILTARAQAMAMTGRFERGARLMRAYLDQRRTMMEAHPGENYYRRSYAVMLGMVADLYADHGDKAEACPMYGEARGIFDDLAAKGELARQDVDGSVRLIRERQATNCPT